MLSYLPIIIKNDFLFVKYFLTILACCQVYENAMFALDAALMMGQNWAAPMNKKDVPPEVSLMFGAMRRKLKEGGWSQRKLCAALGRSESWLSKILHAGRGMDVLDLMRICEVTGIPPAELLSGYPCPTNPHDEAEALAKKLNAILPADVREALDRLRPPKE